VHCRHTRPYSRCMQQHDELEALPSTVPCSMCQLEAAPLVHSSVARCLTCRDTVCVAHLKAHNAVHNGRGHKVFFLSNQNLAQFAQSAADLDTSSHVTGQTIRPTVSSPDMASTSYAPLSAASAEATRSSASSFHSNGTIAASFADCPASSTLWREPVGYFGASAAVTGADIPWAAPYRGQMPWVDNAWGGSSLAAAGAADDSQISPLFVGQRSVRGGDGFSGGLW
jgi:hypothetical protein